jgi:Zn-dependent protease with chaperone function
MAEDPSDHNPDLHWVARWSPEERESFFTAIERNRRASWQVSVAAVVTAVIIALIVASLLAPLVYGVLGLMLDLINLLIPMPDLIGFMVEQLGKTIDSLPGGEQAEVSLVHNVLNWIEFGVLAALPGVALMVGVLFALYQATGSAQTFEPYRAPDHSRLEEQRFANVVSEMALAALLPEPRVLVSERASANALFLEDGADRTAVVVSRDLLQGLDRDALQGVAAHLIGSLCNGDVKNGHRIAMLTGLFALLARMGTDFADTGVLRLLRRLCLTALWPTAVRARALLAELIDPFASPEPAPRSAAQDQPTWKQWVWMPLIGPVALSGLLAGIVATFMLSPLLAWAWRRRRLLADATAVRLTRNPDGIAQGLSQASGMAATDPIEPWAAHLALIEPPRAHTRAGSSFVDGAVARYYPGLRQRLEALAAQGADITLAPKQGMPWYVLALVVPLVALLVALLAVLVYLLIVVSLMLSMLFTFVPVILLHLLLR